MQIDLTKNNQKVKPANNNPIQDSRSFEDSINQAIELTRFNVSLKLYNLNYYIIENKR